MDPQLLLFRRQYLQLFEPEFLAWPPKQLLRDADAQEWLYQSLFNADRNSYLPPERYQLRVLKPLLAKIEQAVEDPEEDVGVCPRPIPWSLVVPLFFHASLKSRISLILSLHRRRSLIT